MTAPRRAAQQGFTLIEVMVALVIVAFGMGAVLASLSSAANNIAALHDKTLAQWIALNLVADARLNLQLPQAGVVEGDVKAFGNGDWHWQRDIEPVPAIPGLLEISVHVRRIGSSTSGSSSGGSGWSSGGSGWSSGGSGRSGSSSSSGSGSLARSSTFGSSTSSGGLGLSSGSSGALGAVSASISKLTSGGKDQNWLASVVGFRGDAVAASSGEAPDWAGTSVGSSSSSSSSSSGGTGAIVNPGNSTSSGGSSLIGSSSGSGSSGGN
jgi:type II secretion system protein I